MTPLEEAREKYDDLLCHTRFIADIRRRKHPTGVLCCSCGVQEHRLDARWLAALHAVSKAWSEEYQRTGVVPRDPTRTLAKSEERTET